MISYRINVENRTYVMLGGETSTDHWAGASFVINIGMVEGVMFKLSKRSKLLENPSSHNKIYYE